MKLTHLVTPLATTLAAALALGLAACSQPDTPGKPVDAKPVSSAQLAQPIEAVATQGKGFSVGAVMSAHTVYVLFDPQCPHCGRLWEAAQPLQRKAKFVWMPVSIMNAKSSAQGAALLQAGNPSETMSAHEKSILAGTGGMVAPASAAPEIELSIRKNTELFNSLQITSVPYLIARHAKTGAVVTNTGAMDTAALAAFLGLDL